MLGCSSCPIHLESKQLGPKHFIVFRSLLIWLDCGESKPHTQNSEFSDLGVPMAMDTDDGARTVAYNIPGFFQSLYPSGQLSSSDNVLSMTYKHIAFSLSAFPPIPENSKGVVKLMVIWSKERYHSPKWPRFERHTGSTGFGCQAWQSERVAVARDRGGKRKKPDVIGATTKIRDIEEAENTRDSACTRSVHTQLVFSPNDCIA